MSEPRLVLHPGHPKCGSSSIQHALFSNLEDLRTHGVITPVPRPNQVFQQACIRQESAALDGWIKDILSKTRREGGDTVVISAENLAVRRMVTEGRPVHESLFRAFGTVDVIYYVRRQDDWMVSQWQQWGHKQGWDLEAFIEDRIQQHQPDYLAAATVFEEVYGPDRVSVVPLHAAALLGGDLLADFTQRSGVGPLATRAGGRTNASMGGYFCDVLARVPRVYDQHLTSRVSEGVTDVSIRRLLERSVRSGDLLFNGDKRIMSASQRRRVLRHFEAENRELHERHFADVSFDLVFGPPEDDDPLQTLSDRVDGLTDVVAIQLDLILKLLQDAERPGWLGAFRRRVASVARKLRRG